MTMTKLKVTNLLISIQSEKNNLDNNQIDIQVNSARDKMPTTQPTTSCLRDFF